MPGRGGLSEPVLDRFAALAETGRGQEGAAAWDAPCPCCGVAPRGLGRALALGYAPALANGLPTSVWESSCPAGCPFLALGGAPLGFGETVLDLGCGGGADLCIAARIVGPAGRAIGVDGTPEMVERAQSAAAVCGVDAWSDVLCAAIDSDHPDVPAGIADVVISNGAFNLCERKT
mmetsp:Transcript_39196/g.124773  ORF Transcript_39196/g.124773 Transcript_39196/m.124773 type:complete len:176 (+) Transcript_39196:1338-1865(+)